jgi:hypothetical protein
MTASACRLLPAALLAACSLAACGGGSTISLGGLPGFSSEQPPPPAPGPLPKPSINPEDIVGRWGLAAFHKPEDRPRTEAAARGQCKQPYIINRSSTGVAMLGHDSPSVQDMTIKANYDGKTYVGPTAEPATGDDREVVSYDGQVLVLRWVDPEIAGRYGTMVLVRCGPEGTNRPRKAAK